MSQSTGDRGRTNPPGNDESSESEEEQKVSTKSPDPNKMVIDMVAEPRWLLGISSW